MDPDQKLINNERRSLYENKELHSRKNCPYKSSGSACSKCKATPSPDVRCAKCGLKECRCPGWEEKARESARSRGGGGVPDATDRFAEYDQEHYQRGRRKRRKSKKRKSKKRKSHKRKSHKRKSHKRKSHKRKSKTRRRR